MTAAIVFALLAGQGPAPTLPAGTSPAFAQAALAVEAKLVAGDVPGAREAARRLPVRTPVIAWANDDLLTPELQKARQAALDRAVRSWRQRALGFAAKAPSEAPDVTIGFAPVLPDGPDGLPLATSVEAGPTFRATIGLTRGKPGVPLRVEEMTMEVAYALGRYLGVAETPFPGSSMYRDARPGLLTLMPQRLEAGVAAGNLDLADRLRAAIEAGKPTGLTVPSLRLIKPRLDLGEVRQGTPINATIDFENTGQGPLDYWVEPDCSCFTMFPPARVASGGLGKALVAINTAESLGRQDKRLLFHSNDPLRPTIEVPVTFRSRPAYRLFRPGGENVVVPKAGGAFDVFLYADADSTLAPISQTWEGIDAKVTRAPWSGNLADPEMGEGPLPRKGWRFRVRISPKLLPGRTPGTLRIRTNDPVFGTLLYSMSAQKGIVPLQEAVYFGDMAEGTRATAIVSRPNAPFKILGVDAGPLKATWQDRRGGWEYGIDLRYAGGSPKGDFSVPVKIRTDDPKQPVIEILANGNVK